MTDSSLAPPGTVASGVLLTTNAVYPPAHGRETEGEVTRVDHREPEILSTGRGVGGRAALGAPAIGAFVQILTEAVNSFCHKRGLDFDERALLEHLLDNAERLTGVVADCT